MVVVVAAAAAAMLVLLLLLLLLLLVVVVVVVVVVVEIEYSARYIFSCGRNIAKSDLSVIKVNMVLLV
jgi:ABC-type xylose transport system permease subunit